MAGAASSVHFEAKRSRTRSPRSELLRLAEIVERREPEIDEHCKRVAAYVTAFAIHLHLPNEDVETLQRAAMLHDVGMALVPEHVLEGIGPLSETEMAAIREHPVVASHLCSQIPALQAVGPVLRSHHERLDGTGYPDGLRGRDIPFLAQVLSIVDAYDAVTSGHMHQRAHSSEEALRELQRDVHRGWRQKWLVRQFIEMFENRPLRHQEPNEPYLTSIRELLAEQSSHRASP